MRSGNTFGGWFTDNYTFNNIYNKESDDIYREGTISYNIFAKWTPKDYTVNYYVGDGATISPTSFTKIFDMAITSELAVPTKTGYTFGGWYCDGLFTTPYDKTNDSIYREGTVTYNIYARWTANTYSIRFNLNAADANVANSISDLTKAYGTNATLPTPTNVKQGYRFIGWYENAECTGTAYDGTTDLSNVQGDT